MPSFNKVMMIGNLTRDPQVKNLSGGLVVAEFGLAMNRKFRTAAGEDKEEVCFVDCTAFGKQAETIAQWCKKGKQLFVEGRLKLDQWEDRIGGAKRSKLTVVVENFQFLGTRDDFGGLPFGASSGPSHSSSDASNRSGGGHPGTRPDDAEKTTDRAHAPAHADRQPAGAAADRQDKADRPDRAAARPQRGNRAPARQSAEQPFGEEKMFEEADIPF